LGEVYPGAGCDTTGGVEALEALAVDGSVTHSAMANAAVTLNKGKRTWISICELPDVVPMAPNRSSSSLDGDPD
jgi:hypothetical protein